MRKLILPLIVAFVAVGGTAAFMFLSRSTRRSVEEAAGGPTRDPKGAPGLAVAPADAGDGSRTAREEPRGDSQRADSPPDAVTLHGQVTDEEGTGLAGSRVYILPAPASLGDGWQRSRVFRERMLGKDSRAFVAGARAGSLIVAEATARASGYFSIPLAAVPPGEYSVLARHAAHAPRKEKWMCTAESFELNFRLGPGEEISGIVLDPDGKTVAGASVEASPDEGEGGFGGFAGGRGPGDSVVDRDETDTAGRFSLSVAAGQYRLAAARKGFARGLLRGIASDSSDVEITLGAGRNITGRVVNESGAPVEGARVLLFRGLGGGDSPRSFGDDRGGSTSFLRLIRTPDAEGDSDAGGRFEFPDLSASDYVVMARKAGRVPAETKANVTEDVESASVELSLAPGIVLSGVVTHDAGEPIHGAFVVVAEDRGAAGENPGQRGGDPVPGVAGVGGAAGVAGGLSPGGPTAQVRRANPISLFRAAEAAETTAEGKFLFDTLPRGTYALSVQMEDFVPHRQNGIELEAPVDLKVVLEPGIRMEGRVLSSIDRKPIPKARVRFAIADDDRREAQTGDDGRYAIGGLFAVKVGAIEVDAHGFALQVHEDFAIPESPEVQTQDFTLDLASRLGGQVTDTHGAPVAQARVTVAGAVAEQEEASSQSLAQRRRQQIQSRSARTDSEGKFTLEEVNAASRLQISIEHPEHKRFRSDPFSITPGDQADGLQFVLHAGGRLEVTVTDRDRKAVEGARVALGLEKQEEPGDPAQGQAGQSDDEQRSRLAALRSMRSRLRGITRQTAPGGKAVFAGLEGRNYTLAVSRDGFQPFSASTAIIEDQTLPYPVQLLPENTITGNVQDRFGVPVKGATVQAEKDGGSRFPGDSQGAKTGGDGAFRVGSLGDGTYTLRVRSEGFASKSEPRVEVNAQVSIVLERLGGISGVVAVSETGEPVTSFQVRLREESDRSGDAAGNGPGGAARFFGQGGDRRSRGERKSFNDPSGAFLLSNIAPGGYILQVTAADHAGAEVRVHVEDGAVTQGVQVLLVEGLSVVGTIVLKGTESPVAGAEVFLVPVIEDAADDRSATTLAERREARGAEREKRLAALRDREAGEVLANKTDTLLAQLTGVALQAARRGGGSLAVSDAAGSFQLKEVPVGRYTLVVNHEAYVPARVNVAIGEDRVARSLRIDLESGESLSGTVILEDGSAAAGTTVTVRDSFGTQKRTQADSAGRYFVQGLLAGAYKLSGRSALGGSIVRGQTAEIQIVKGANHFDYRFVPSQ